MTTSTTERRQPTTVREIARVKARLYGDMRALQAPGADVPALRRTLIRRYVTEYLPALDDLAASTDPALLASRLRDLATRLERGWGVPGPTADALFKRLLLELEVLSDVLALAYTDGGQTPLQAFLERVDRWDRQCPR